MKKMVGTVFILTILLTNNACPQFNDNRYTKNSIYFEVLGQGILYSVNYEHRFTQKMSFRIGYTSWRINLLPIIFFVDGFLDVRGFPIMMSYLSGDGNNHLEFGIGIVGTKMKGKGEDIFFGTEIEGENTLILGTGTLGYRYQPSSNGLLFKIGLTPFYNAHTFQLSGGISLGYAF